ncbi:hypothetical protein COLO4_37412 [Corchorus olitorius]|uniref:Uncharacterized protein n=1 Tax=Corchorus olitorius TaxID=93759 RepID=A0A1R3G208_9ROSI|nr:hypothetical protein COLO4_37412 [Corchorus olitorius]
MINNSKSDHFPSPVKSSNASSKEDGDVCNTEATKEDSEVDCEKAVRVQKIGDCLDLHFKCPCGKGYQILLSGQNCYYKLI